MSAESVLYLLVRLGAGTLAWVATYLVHSTVLLAGAWWASTRSASAQTRELLWRVALLGGLATATLQATGAVPAAFTRVSTGGLVEARHWSGQAPSAPVASVQAPWGEAPSDGTSAPERYASRLPSAGTVLRAVPLALVLAWMVFAGAMLARLAFATRRARRSMGRRRDVQDPGVLALLRDACARLGFRRPVRLTVSESLGTPVALGRAEICLPRRALEECSDEEMRAVLSHEVAHLVRHDPAWLLVSATMESIFFFQPLNRAARIHLQEQAEYLSDQLAVEHAGSLRLALARALAAVGGWLSAESEPLLAP
ncbi:MAG TPA: M56 family metallopeptidase, partial [Longimicrobium sp.]